jgi:hypothetical protein
MILALGGVINNALNRPLDNEKSNWIWGWVIIVGIAFFVIVLLFGLLPLIIMMLQTFSKK